MIEWMFFDGVVPFYIAFSGLWLSIMESMQRIVVCHALARQNMQIHELNINALKRQSTGGISFHALPLGQQTMCVAEITGDNASML